MGLGTAVGKLGPAGLAGGNRQGAATVETVWWLLKKLNNCYMTQQCSEANIPKLKTGAQTDTCKPSSLQHDSQQPQGRISPSVSQQTN